MSTRSHMIYAHTAGSDGYDFFYLYYFPGGESIYIKWRACGGEVQEFGLEPVPMLDWVERQLELTDGDPVARCVWDAAAKCLRRRIRKWLEESQER